MVWFRWFAWFNNRANVGMDAPMRKFKEEALREVKNIRSRFSEPRILEIGVGTGAHRGIYSDSW